MLGLDETKLTEELAGLLDRDTFREGIRNLTSDRFFVTFFLSSVSQGEGLGATAVGMVGQEELARRILDLKRQEEEERGHKEQTLEAARSLFPEYFENGQYRYRHSLQGRRYYVEVLEANRARLKELGRYSRLNLYFTTTFAYEVMVVLLYRTVADAMRRSPLPPAVRDRVSAVLDRILAEEETHLGVIDQHCALLRGSRQGLSDDARAMLDKLALLSDEDYRFPTEMAVRHVVEMTSRYANAATYRAQIESGQLAEE